jgi:hypothetical protein
MKRIRKFDIERSENSHAGLELSFAGNVTLLNSSERSREGSGCLLALSLLECF